MSARHHLTGDESKRLIDVLNCLRESLLEAEYFAPNMLATWRSFGTMAETARAIVAVGELGISDDERESRMAAVERCAIAMSAMADVPTPFGAPDAAGA